jgi:RNA polymerase sigma-70 factor (ECF subfamily)
MVSDQAASPFPIVTTATGRRPPSLENEVTELFDRWRDPLLRYILTIGLPVHDGEEIVQEVFLALFQHLAGAKPRTNLRGWVFRVGHNLALKRRIAAGTHLLDGAHCQVHDPAPDPEAALATKQRQSRLLAVVEALPEQDRQCLNLRAEGLRYREIAEVLGISLGSVAASLSRSLERLRRADRQML